MKYPSLVPDIMCRTPVTLAVYTETLDENGAPVIAGTYTGMCNYQSSGKLVRRDKEEFVTMTGKCLFNGDILPGVPVIASGEAVIFGAKREILSGSKARNPDGTVNYTEVNLG